MPDQELEKMPAEDKPATERVDSLRARLGKPPPLSPEEQSRRFLEVARAVGASKDEDDIDEALGRITKAGVKPPE